MASENKKSKAKNAYCNGCLKEKRKGIRRLHFYTAAQRKQIQKEVN